MTGEKKWFSSLTPVKDKMYITFGDNGRGRVISEGVVHVSNKVMLKRVWCMSVMSSLVVTHLASNTCNNSFKARLSILILSKT
jgi:hypothetical protein